MHSVRRKSWESRTPKSHLCRYTCTPHTLPSPWKRLDLSQKCRAPSPSSMFSPPGSPSIQATTMVMLCRLQTKHPKMLSLQVLTPLCMIRVPFDPTCSDPLSVYFSGCRFIAGQGCGERHENPGICQTFSPLQF